MSTAKLTVLDFCLKKKQEKTSSAKQPTIRLLGISIAFLLQSPWDVGCRKKKNTNLFIIYVYKVSRVGAASTIYEFKLR